MRQEEKEKEREKREREEEKKKRESAASTCMKNTQCKQVTTLCGVCADGREGSTILEEWKRRKRGKG